ncbi:MAG: SPOR domain-containing protein [Spirochaetaceae bacterium]|nr:SPOR domain-containing protein [Spirochaetaceae bacterium]
MFLLALLHALFLGVPLQGESSLAAELRDLEARLAAEPPAGERGGLLRRRARLMLLAGDLEGAAAGWSEAALIPGGPDYESLLEAARCHIALGDYAAADAALQRALDNAPPPLRREAQYLAVLGGAFRSGDGTGPAALLEAPEYAGRRPALLYTLYRLSGREEYRARLLRDHPGSPEGILSRDNEPPVTAAARPMWFFYQGREGLAFEAPLPAPAALPPAVPAAAPLLQTGLFSREEYAGAMAERLRRAGFSAEVIPREVRGSNFYVVAVPPGESVNGTILRLRDAGFEAFPVY